MEMTVKQFFELMEKTNDFKSLIGEVIKTKVIIKCDDDVIGKVHTLEQFLNIVGDELKDIDVQKTSSSREFKIVFEENG